MAHVVRIIKAARLRSKWKHLLQEKFNSFNENETDSEFSRGSEFNEKPDRWWLKRLIKKIRTPNATRNFVCKSLMGFVGGILLTYAFFLFFYVGVSFSLRTTTCVCGLGGIFLSLGLAFSEKVRCYVLLMLPVFFTKHGRQALLTYALFLAFTGPAKTSMHNMGVLSDSLACGQEMVKRTLKQIIDMVKAPFKSAKETMEELTKPLKEVIDSVKDLVKKIKRIIFNILTVITQATVWLERTINLCTNKIGTPFQRCMKSFDDAIADCRAKLGVLDFLCHVVHIVKALCYTVKCLDFICLFTEFATEKVIRVMHEKLTEFNLRMKNLFFVSIDFSHSCKFETKASTTTKEVAKTILKTVSKKVEKLQSIFSIFGFIFSLFFLFVFFKVYYYKYKYLTSDRYDNVYISKYIVDLDIKRYLADRETILPLESREKKKYAEPTAFRLLKDEKKRMMQSMFFLCLSSFKVITFVVFDYSLYWILLTMYETGRESLTEVEKSHVALHVEGKGILAKFYRKLGKTFEVPENPNMHLNSLHCLPDPMEPDTNRYIQIGFLLVLCWVFTLLEAYGLRLRNVVMSHYYPDRAKERALWLYNHILRSRASFLRYARRQLRKKFGVDSAQPIEKGSMTLRLFANFPVLSAIVGKSKENNCYLCGASETEKKPLKRCKTPDCRGRYCPKCFATLENVCTICQHPIEYGDITDISEEIDSSEAESYSTSSNQKNSTQHCSEEKFQTFKDMEFRGRFRDVESNKLTDFARLGDLYTDKEALRRRIREILNKQMERINKEKDKKSQIKRSMYKEIKLKAQRLLFEKKKKLTKNQPIKSVLKKPKPKTSDTEDLTDESKPTKSRVSFKLSEDENPIWNYRLLQDKVKEKINYLKSIKKSESPALEPASCSSLLAEEESVEALKTPEENPERRLLVYYFVESEGSSD